MVIFNAVPFEEQLIAVPYIRQSGADGFVQALTAHDEVSVPEAFIWADALIEGKTLDNGKWRKLLPHEGVVFILDGRMCVPVVEPEGRVLNMVYHSVDPQESIEFICRRATGFLDTIHIWPDGSYCLPSEESLEEALTYRSDDFVTYEEVPYA
jgi:hypothetical protein